MARTCISPASQKVGRGLLLSGRMAGMDSIDARLIMELRKRTGLPVPECKQAQIDAGGDLEVAVERAKAIGVTQFNLRKLIARKNPRPSDTAE